MAPNTASNWPKRPGFGPISVKNTTKGSKITSKMIIMQSEMKTLHNIYQIDGFHTFLKKFGFYLLSAKFAPIIINLMKKSGNSD